MGVHASGHRLDIRVARLHSRTDAVGPTLFDSRSQLALAWTQAAVQSEHIFGINDSPPEARAAL